MFKQGNRRLSAILMALTVVIANVIAPVAPAFADQNPPGNNGTLQVHEKGSAVFNPSNEPRVCVFNFEGLGLDANQSGSVTIKTQGGSSTPTTVGTIQLQTDADGNGSTGYINDTDSTLTIPNGHYKATLDRKFGTDNSDKAKSKVFWVDCGTASANVAIISPATCTNNSVASVTNLVNAVLTSNNGILDESVGLHTALFTATTGSIFTNGTPTYSVDYTITAKLDCGPLKDATAAISVSQPTCDSNSVATVDENNTHNAYLVGSLNQNVGWHMATFKANDGHVFASGQSTIDVPYYIKSHKTGIECAGPKPGDDHQTRTTDGKVICLPGGGGTVTTWTEERSRSYHYNHFTNKWEPGRWSHWNVVPGSKTTRPATEAECPRPIQTQPTCDTDGSLTLPAYRGDWHKDYKYIVTIGFIVKTYDADKAVTITGIPQGARVTVKLVSDDCFHKVIFSKEYDFDVVDCVIATPEQPQTNDECGPDNAFWIVPANTNDVHWSVNTDGHLIATAIGGHFANGATTIDYGVAEDSNEPCPPSSTPVTPVKPRIIDCEVILPITLGVTYTKVYLDANGSIVNPNLPGVIVAHEGVLATANPGYVLTPGNDGGKWLDNGSYLYTLDFTDLNCGGGSITPPVITPPVVTPPTVIPPTVTPVSTALPTPAELPRTGSSLSGLLVTFLATLTTYGVVYLLQPKRR